MLQPVNRIKVGVSLVFATSVALAIAISTIIGIVCFSLANY
jgi:hypothetical protein